MIPRLDFRKMLPPDNLVYNIGPSIWRVTYSNNGKLSISSQLVGIKIGHDMVITPGGETYSIDNFEKMRRERWPMSHENGRNPENISLSIHKGQMEEKIKYAET